MLTHQKFLALGERERERARTARERILLRKEYCFESAHTFCIWLCLQAVPKVDAWTDSSVRFINGFNSHVKWSLQYCIFSGLVIVFSLFTVQRQAFAESDFPSPPLHSVSPPAPNRLRHEASPPHLYNEFRCSVDAPWKFFPAKHEAAGRRKISRPPKKLPPRLLHTCRRGLREPSNCWVGLTRVRQWLPSKLSCAPSMPRLARSEK